MKTTKEKESFGIKFQKLFTSAVKQRAFLNTTNRGKQNEAAMRHAMDKLYPHLHTTFTDRAAARFLIENQYTISQIIPAHMHQMKSRLQNLVTVAKQYQP